MPIVNRAEHLHCFRQMVKFASDCEAAGADLTDPDTIQWLRTNPEFRQYSDKMYMLQNDGQRPPDRNWLENAQADVPSSQLWRAKKKK